MVGQGHRCAFVRLMQPPVAGDRVADLREMALPGDQRAGVMLAKYRTRRGDEAALRRGDASSAPRQVAGECHREKARSALRRRAGRKGPGARLSTGMPDG